MHAVPVVSAEWRECAETSDKCAAVEQGILSAHKRRTLQQLTLPIDGPTINVTHISTDVTHEQGWQDVVN